MSYNDYKVISDSIYPGMTLLPGNGGVFGIQ